MRLHRLIVEGENAAEVEFEGANETVIAIVEGISTELPGSDVFIIADAYWLQSAGTTATVMKIRRGKTTAGTEVASCEINSVVAKKNECTLQGRDIVGAAAGASYCFTLTETKAGEKPKAAKGCRIRAEY